MRAASPGRMIAPVTTKLHIHLELLPTEPVTGLVYDEHGERQPFAGWLSLNSELERLWARSRREEAAGAKDQPSAPEAIGGRND